MRDHTMISKMCIAVGFVNLELVGKKSTIFKLLTKAARCPDKWKRPIQKKQQQKFVTFWA